MDLKHAYFVIPKTEIVLNVTELVGLVLGLVLVIVGIWYASKPRI